MLIGVISGLATVFGLLFGIGNTILGAPQDAVLAFLAFGVGCAGVAWSLKRLS